MNYREYGVTVTRTITVRVRVEDSQAEPILLARDMALAVWRDPEPDTHAFRTSATETHLTSDTHVRTTVVDVTPGTDDGRGAGNGE